VPQQLDLGFEQAAEPVAQEVEKETITYQRSKKAHPGRDKLPEDIPTEDIIIEPEEDTTDMERIGEEITETIDYRPGLLIKRRYIRPKYARKEALQEQPGVLIAELPERPIPKGIAEPGLLAHLFVSKYIDHLPFYRQTKIFKRQHDWDIHKATINSWFVACCTLMEPLYEALFKQVMQTDYLQADESPIKVLDADKKGSSHQGYMWVYRNPLNGLVLFDYRKGRGMHGPKERLENYEGYLQCDGYKVYKRIAKKQQGIKLLSCLAHIRRYFFKAKHNHPELANYAMAQIQQLYAIERQCRNDAVQHDKRLEVRQEEAKPIFEELLEWVNTQHKNNLRKEPIGKALNYANNQLPLLKAYLKDGRIEIDNNLIENAIRPLALGRKNYLFAGSHDGARRAAMMYSFFASCKTMDINPWEWMKDTLEKISSHPVNDIEALLPNNQS
jgi:transposase